MNTRRSTTSTDQPNAQGMGRPRRRGRRKSVVVDALLDSVEGQTAQTQGEAEAWTAPEAWRAQAAGVTAALDLVQRQTRAIGQKQQRFIDEVADGAAPPPSSLQLAHESCGCRVEFFLVSRAFCSM